MKKSWIALLIAVGVIVVLIVALAVYLRLNVTSVFPGVI
jgi:hypothetical protein